MTPEALLKSGIAALAKNDTDAARTYFAACVEEEHRSADMLYLMAICSYLDGKETDAAELLSWSRSTGEVTADFFPTLGDVLAALGPDKGDDVRRYLQRHRQIPWQLVGTMIGGDLGQMQVEPWFFSRRAVHGFPGKQAEFEDPARIIDKYILPGFVPDVPLFTDESVLLTMGSCFAQELRNYLAEHGKRSDWLFVPPGLNNTFAVRNFVEWCLTGNRSSDAYWYDEAAEGGAVKWSPEAEQQQYREVFNSIDGLVLTVGLAEVWYDTVTGGVFWRGVPKTLYNPERHKCRVSTVAENLANLNHVIGMIRAVRPTLPIIITLSPIPLRATFEPMSCFVADCISKSTLRVAIDEVMRAGHLGVTYWPSFEIVRWLGGHLGMSMFGEDGNTRHVNRVAVRMILNSFMRHYYRSPASV